jgi:small-conductance mechanosensitive channel
MNPDWRGTGLLQDLLADFQQPDVIWQVGVLLLCFLLAWSVDRWLGQHLVASDEAESRTRAFGRRSLKRLGLPLTMLLLVLAARPLLAHWQHVHLLSLAVALLIAMVVIRSVVFVVRQNFLASAPWLAGFERALAFLAWGVVAMHILGLLPEIIDLLESVSFTLAKEKLNLWMVLQGLGVVLITLLVAMWIGGMIEAHLMRTPGLDGNLRVVFSRLARALLILLAVLIGLPLVGIDLTTLSVFGGALGVGLGFGFQKIAANYVSGFIILLDRSIRLGNLIAVDAQRGIVTRITTRYTVLRSLIGVEMIVPNEMLVSSVITNETFSDRKVRIGLPVQVAYGTDLEQALRLLVAAASGQARVLADPPPKAFVVTFADSGIDLELGFWIGDPEEGTMQVRSDINLAIWRAFQAADISIPFPQREVRILNPVEKVGAGETAKQPAPPYPQHSQEPQV